MGVYWQSIGSLLAPECAVSLGVCVSVCVCLCEIKSEYKQKPTLRVKPQYVLRFDMCTSMISLSKIAHQMWCDHPLQQKRQWGQGFPQLLRRW